MPFAAFERMVLELAPKAAIVLGSGLGGALTGFRELGTIAFADVPGLLPSTVHGHLGRLSVGWLHDRRTLLFHGRLHFYEGHSQAGVEQSARLAARFGVKLFILTNAAGGIHPALAPGSLMAIRQHVKLIGAEAWRDLAALGNADFSSSYSPRLIEEMQAGEGREGRELLAGVYASLTGPCYETPAEIRALAKCGVDAVGMSTALEAEAAAGLGLEVAAVSCITNPAAGAGTGPLNHDEVLDNARLGIQRLGEILGHLVRTL